MEPGMTKSVSPVIQDAICGAGKGPGRDDRHLRAETPSPAKNGARWSFPRPPRIQPLPRRLNDLALPTKLSVTKSAELCSADSRGGCPYISRRSVRAEVRRPRSDARLLLRPLVHPAIHRLVPQPRILRLQHPVAFVGEI